MSNVRISPEKLESAVKKILDEFAEATYADVKTAVDETAKEAVKNTKQNAPVNKHPKKEPKYPPGTYKKSWTSKVTEDKVEVYERTVYAKYPHHALTHLLQNGHGGPWPARAYPHIQQDDDTIRIFEEKLKKEMGR